MSKQNNPIRVMHLLSSSSFSGAENVACQIISLTKDETDSFYCSPDGKIAQTLEDKGVSFIPLKTLSIKEVKKAIKIKKPDVIHAHDVRATLVAVMSAGKIPVISHYHSDDTNAHKTSVKALLYRLAATKVKHIFWVSDAAFQNFKYNKQLASKSSVLYNMVDPAEIKKQAQDFTVKQNYDIIYVGRIAEPKNPEKLIDVINLIKQKNPKVKCAIIGDGVLLDNIKDKSHSLGLDKNIDFLGFKKNPLPYIKASKLMLMTSRYEGTPMCALEALALRRPIVATPVDGLKKLVIDGETGYLRESPEELADKINELILEQKKIKKLQDQVEEFSEELFDLTKYKSEILKGYKG